VPRHPQQLRLLERVVAADPEVQHLDRSLHHTLQALLELLGPGILELGHAQAGCGRVPQREDPDAARGLRGDELPVPEAPGVRGETPVHRIVGRVVRRQPRLVLVAEDRVVGEAVAADVERREGMRREVEHAHQQFGETERCREPGAEQ
jgi:hypothetical protein